MILQHCAGPLSDGYQAPGSTLDLLHCKVIACKNGTDASDCGLWNGVFVVILHILYKLTWVIEQIYPCSLKIPTCVALDFVLCNFPWFVLHHVAGHFHTQHDYWCWLLDPGKDVKVIHLYLLKNTCRLLKQWSSLAQLLVSLSHHIIYLYFFILVVL